MRFDMFPGAFSLSGRQALITGGGTGIGLAISRTFIEAGAQVVMMGRREDVLRKACDGLGKSASYRVGDVSRPETIRDLVATIHQDGIAPDILVNNAGINAKKPALEITDGEFNAIIQ